MSYWKSCVNITIQRYYYNQKPVSNYYQKPTIFLCKRLHKTTPYFLLYKIFSSKKKTLSLYNICISNLSKLRVERTRKSLARNSWVLNDFSYITNTQRITTADSKINKKHERKNASFFCKRTTFALQLYSIYIATVLICTVNVVLLKSKRTTNEKQDAIRPSKKHKNRPRKSLESIFIL